MGFFTSSCRTLEAGAGFILQVNYSHEVLLVKQTAEQLSNFVLGFILNIIILLCFGVVPDWKIIFFPIRRRPLIFVRAASGQIRALPTAVTKDIQRMAETGMGLVMYITPVIYSPNFENPMLQSIIKWNPLTYLVGSLRDIIIYGKTDNLEGYFYASAFSLFVFLFAWRLFYLSEDKIIEKMI